MNQSILSIKSAACNLGSSFYDGQLRSLQYTLGCGNPDRRAADSSDWNDAMVTVESRPVRKEPGDNMIAGSINDNARDGAGSLQMRVMATG